MKTTIQILFLLLIAAACRKPDNQNVVTIEGQLMSGCNTPAANKSGFILEESSLLGGPGVSLDFTTDENGYFKVTHTGKGNLSSFMVRVQGSSDVLKVSGLADRQKDLGKVYINPFPTKFIIKLDVQNTYTENDTLMLFDFNNPNAMPFDAVYIPGPFTSGALDSVVNYNFSKFPIHFSPNGSTTPIVTIRHIVRSSPSNILSDKYTNFNIAPICSGEFAEVTLVID